MSKIPVEKRRGGMPWWAWLLIAVVVIGLLWLLWPLLFGAAAGALLAPAAAAGLLVPGAGLDRVLAEGNVKEVDHDA